MAWFSYPIWALTCFMKMLAALQAERQLTQIEAVSVPHMKQDAIGRLMGRLQKRASRERPKSVAEQLMEHMEVVYEPVEKVTDGG